MIQKFSGAFLDGDLLNEFIIKCFMSPSCNSKLELSFFISAVIRGVSPMPKKPKGSQISPAGCYVFVDLLESFFEVVIITRNFVNRVLAV